MHFFGKITNTLFFKVALAVLIVTDATVALAGQNGAIEGVVKTPWVRRYQAVVFIEHVEGEFPPPRKYPFISQIGLVFSPHIMPVLKGTTIDFTNDDTVVHNVFAPPGAATQFNLGIYGPGVKKTATFDTLGEVPLLCSVHPEMLAYVIVLQNPYYALSDKAGKFKINGVPPGTYQLKMWNEKLRGASQEVMVRAGETTLVTFKGLKKR